MWFASEEPQQDYFSASSEMRRQSSSTKQTDQKNTKFDACYCVFGVAATYNAICNKCILGRHILRGHHSETR